MVQLIRGHLRDIIGRMELNEALGSTSQINAQLADAIGDLTDIYGIRVVRSMLTNCFLVQKFKRQWISN